MIDFHTHLGRVHYDRNTELSPRLLVDFLDKNDIEKCVLLPLENPESTTYYFLTREALAAYREFPDRIIPFCSVDPRMEGLTKPEHYERAIKEYISEGCKGFGEHKPGVPLVHPRSQWIYEICGNLGLPVLMHLDPAKNTDTVAPTGLHDLEQMLIKYPKTNFIMHATVWWREVSAVVDPAIGYPKGPVVRTGRADELLGKYPNIYGDLSAGSGFGAISRDPEFGRDFMERHKHRLLFATDYLMIGQKTPIVEYIRQVGLSKEAFEAITSGNAKQLLTL